MLTPRRRILVDRRFQLRYALIWLWVALFVLVMLGLFYNTVRSYLRSPGMDAIVLRMVGGMGIFVVCYCMLMGALTTGLTHRVAGAAFALQRAIERLRSNELDAPVRLRPSDYLQTLAGELEELREGLAAQRAAILEVATALDAPLTDEQRAAIAARLRGTVAVKPPPVPTVVS